MQHLNVRQSGNTILTTSSPAEIDGVPASWPLHLHLHLHNDVDGGLNEVVRPSRTGMAMSSARCSVRRAAGGRTRGLPPMPRLLPAHLQELFA
ncbi:hypothetical protein [Streptomyces sp. NPDC005547]|uniref:hypothetical protein n=1 Tax=Streptomyces sp. NPDC005547 TaxID=3154887 RepID=UPI0033A7918B